MTLALLERIGIKTSFEEKTISIPFCSSVDNQIQTVESDWSSASYWFSVLALADQGVIQLSHYREDSLQGDAVLRDIYSKLGVETHFNGSSLVLKKVKNFNLPEKITLDLVQAPDIAQTIAVSCYGLGVACHLTGLHTLKIKETDRLLALEKELGKLGATIAVDHNSLQLSGRRNFQEGQSIDTYHDHRMAMAFAPLAIKIPLTINDAAVVSKSYPTFWEDMKKAGFQQLTK